ncbi:hypothetical protein GUJ93_ZPchr0007g3942 [Zizania palustris]|uniref:Uncharacterized protein n=1 Tax=Zizania palustris TaxID=103762 RepID=A0A8J5TJP4_ZIZPA|nr:hypothetical protein GUJ93_ZPchr0007g3942 [Zizania palustris]
MRAVDLLLEDAVADWPTATRSPGGGPKLWRRDEPTKRRLKKRSTRLRAGDSAAARCEAAARMETAREGAGRLGEM